MPFKHTATHSIFLRISIASAQWEAASHVVGHSTKVDPKVMTGRFYFWIWGPTFMEILCVPELVLNRLWLFGFADLTCAKCEFENCEPPEFQIIVLQALFLVVHLELAYCPLLLNMAAARPSGNTAFACTCGTCFTRFNCWGWNSSVVALKIETSWKVGDAFPTFISGSCITDDLYRQRWHLISLCGTRQKLQKCSSFRE